MKTSSLSLEKHFSRRQVADLAGVHPETIKRAQKCGDLPAVILNSRLTRYRESDVMRWLDARPVADKDRTVLPVGAEVKAGHCS